MLQKKNICFSLAKMDPTLKARISNQLLRGMPRFSKALSRAAKYILDHPAEFGVHPIRETAARIGVSTSTLVRLSAALDLDSFEDLRAPFREALLVSDVSAEDVGWLHRLNEQGGSAGTQALASASAIGNVSKSLRDLDHEALERLVERFFDARQVYVAGWRASYSLACYFYYVARMALPNMFLVPRQMNPAIDDFAFAGESDLLFAISAYPYSLDIVRTCAFAREKQMGVTLLSDSLVSAGELQADEILVASTVSTYHFPSYVGMMSVLETLLATIVAYGGETVRARIADYEELRDRTEAYWRPAKKNKRSYRHN
jgi:DNA-binding MurR/RpiR family transcriptional regulator